CKFTHRQFSIRRETGMRMDEYLHRSNLDNMENGSTTQGIQSSHRRISFFVPGGCGPKNSSRVRILDGNVPGYPAGAPLNTRNVRIRSPIHQRTCTPSRYDGVSTSSFNRSFKRRRGKLTPASIANWSEPQKRPLISIRTDLPVRSSVRNSTIATP